MRKQNILYFFMAMYFMCLISIFAESVKQTDTTNTNDYIYDNTDAKIENRYEKRTNMPKGRHYYPFVDGNIYAKYTANVLDDNKKDYRGNGDNSSYFDIKSELNVNFAKYLILSSTFNFSQSAERETRFRDIGIYGSDFFNREGYVGRNSFGKNYTLRLEEFYLSLITEDFMLGVGKFNPTFALAYDNTYYNGIMGTRFTEQYRLEEMDGVFTAMLLPFFTLRFNLFTEDTTFLSRSLINSRTKSLKGYNAGNTNKLDSFSITSEFIISNKYKINIGLRRLAVDDDDKIENNLSAERGYVIGFKTVFEPENEDYGFNIYPSIEAVQIQNYRGETKRNLTHFTVNLPLIYNNWNLTFTESAKYDKNGKSGYDNTSSNLFEINIGYRFNFGLMLDVSRTFGKEYIKDFGYAKEIVDTTTYKSYSSLDAWNFMISYMYKFF